MTNSSAFNICLQHFVDAFCRACNSLFAPKGGDWKFSAGDGESAVPTEGSPVWFFVTAPTAANGEAAVMLPAPCVSTLARVLLGENEFCKAAASEPAIIDKEVSTIKNMLQQAMAQAMGEVTGKSAEFLAQLSSQEPSWQPAARGTVVCSSDSSNSCKLELYFSESWLALLRSMSADQRADRSEQPGMVPAETTLGLLMDADLDMTLRFGRRLLPLKDIVVLASGVVIELENHVQDPVELLLGEKVVARGEVVVTDGSYGLRVTEYPLS